LGRLALGLQNYVFDSVRPEDRAKAIALYSTVNAVGWSVGALLGSWLVERLPSRIEWQESSSSLLPICLLSSFSQASCGCWSRPAFLAPSMKRAKWRAFLGNNFSGIAAPETRCPVCGLDPTQIESVGAGSLMWHRWLGSSLLFFLLELLERPICMATHLISGRRWRALRSIAGAGPDDREHRQTHQACNHGSLPSLNIS